jgi:hypothetical protein
MGIGNGVRAAAHGIASVFVGGTERNILVRIADIYPVSKLSLNVVLTCLARKHVVTIQYVKCMISSYV